MYVALNRLGKSWHIYTWPRLFKFHFIKFNKYLLGSHYLQVTSLALLVVDFKTREAHIIPI